MTDAFYDLIDVYVIARDTFGRECTLKALRRHYADSCSHGDHVIHTMINLLDEETVPPYLYTHEKNEEENEKEEENEDLEYFAAHISDNLEYWLQEGRPRPNPWWAS